MIKSDSKAMKAWKKGAILGGIWGLFGVIPYSYISTFDDPFSKILITLIGFPTFIALTMNLHFSFIFISSPIIGIFIGGGIGYIIENIKIEKYKKEENISEKRRSI